EGQRVFTLSSNKGTNWVYDLISIKTKINEAKPEVIINFVGTFTNDYSKSYKVNVLAAKNLLDAVIMVNYNGKLILIGSAAEYGIQEKYYEDCVEKPRSIYGLTKLMQHSLFQYYVNVFDIKANYIRLFNVCDTKCSNDLFIGNFTRQLNLTLKGAVNEIKLGDLNSYRDYLLIDDIHEGFIKVIESGHKGEVYNLGMGKGLFLTDFVRKVLSTLHLKVKLTIERKNSIGSIDTKVVAEINKINNIGWSPKYDYKNLIRLYCT
ncbi:unnamed protein product, partial [marine sediment metagenome]